jgi:hypothetical protein
MNTSTCAAVAQVPAAPPPHRLARVGLSLLLAASLALSACGGGSSASAPSAAELLKQTLGTHRPISSGELDVSLAVVEAAGRRGSALDLRGRFQGAAPAHRPDFDLTLLLDRAARKLALGAVSTQGRLYLQLAGAWFLAPAGTAAALTRGYEQSAGAPGASAGSPLASIGVDPARWLTSPRVAGHARIGGEDTVHITAAVDAPRFIADARKLSQALISPVGAQLTDPLSLAHISTGLPTRDWVMHVYTGAHDHILRRLTLATAVVLSAPQTGNSIGRLKVGELTFALAIAKPNRPQTIAAPTRTRPPAQLGPALERLGREGALVLGA